MARKWILDTETKGTGAQMVPLDKAEEKQAASGRGVIVAPEHRERPPKERKPHGPRRFKVVDVMTREALGQDLDARAAVDLLKGVRSFVDVSVYVWEDQAGAWQQLTQREQRMLWDRAAAGRG
jgi:hypothetical protein